MDNRQADKERVSNLSLADSVDQPVHWCLDTLHRHRTRYTDKSMLRMNVIKNWPVTSDHVDIAEKIFGIDVATLKGKTTTKQTPKVLEDTVDVPEELYQLNDQLELYIDGMYVNKGLFITSIDKTIRYRCAISNIQSKGERTVHRH